MRVAHVLFSDSAGEAALLPRTPPQWNLSRPTLSPVFVEWLWGNHARTLAAYRNKKHTTHAYFYCATPMPRWKARWRWRRYFHGVPLSFRSQRQGDWGARLTSALEEALTKHDMVCVWPTHIPTLPSGILETAATLYPKALFTPERHGGVAFFSLASIHATALKKITAVRWQTPAAAADFLKVLQAVGVPVVQRGRVSALRSVNDFPRVIRELEEKQDSAALQALYNTLE